MRVLRRLLILGAVAGLAVAPPVPEPRADPRAALKNKYIVTFRNGVDASAHKSWVRSIHAKRDNTFAGIQNEFHSFNAYVGQFDDATVEEIKASPDVAIVEQDREVFLLDVPEKRGLTTQSRATYGLGSLSHRSSSSNYVYDTSAGAGTWAYVLDTGINFQHRDFGGRAQEGFNAYGGDHIDDEGHGTHVAGTIGSATYGVAKKTTLLSVKVWGEGFSSVSIVALGYDWAYQDISWRGRKDRSVINMSIGSDGVSDTINAMVKHAYSEGIVTVCAAGNSALDVSSTSPASAPEAITVAALDQSLQVTNYTNFGSGVDVFAAGNDVLSTYIGSDTATFTLSGTSMASPHVAGLVSYLQRLENLKGPKAVADRVVQLSTKGTLRDPKGSPNRVAYNGNR